MSKVVLIGTGYLEVQRAELVRVVLLPCGVVPRQRVELVSVERLPFKRVVGVHVDLPALQAGPQAELQLETWRDKHDRAHGVISWWNPDAVSLASSSAGRE